MTFPQSLCPPSQLQLALALAIVKSKPTKTTIRDHIVGVRNKIALGRKEQTEFAGDKHLDSTTFWREAYEKSEATQSQLLDKIYNLEQRNEALLLQTRPENRPKTKPAMKRGAKTDDAQLLAPPQPKRTKTACMEKQQSPLLSGQIWGNDAFAGLEFSENATNSLMRQFHTIQKILRKRSNFEALVIPVVELCKNFETTIVSAIEQGTSKISGNSKDKGLRLGEPRLEPILKILERCYPSILQSLTKVSKCTPENAGVGLMVYHIVQLFRKTLQHMHLYTIYRARTVSAIGKSPSGTKQRPRAKTKTTYVTRKAKPSFSHDDETILNCFSHAVVTMLLSLEFETQAQSELLEGFMFVILEHVGKILGLFVFDELRSGPKLDTNRINPSLPACLAHNNPGGVEPAVTERAAVWSCKYLIWILERAMAFLDQHMTRLNSITKPGRSTTESSLRLLDLARTKLQNSLLKGVFGSDAVEFEDSLKLPEERTYTQTDNCNSGSLANCEEDIGEWFVQEVWRIVGWDSLLRFQRAGIAK